MNEQLKQRLVGAAVLVLLAVIFVPMILDRPPDPAPRIERPAPPPAQPGDDFSSRVIPLEPPKTPMVEAERKRATAPVQPPPAEKKPEPEPEPKTAEAPPPAPEPAAAEKPAGPGAWAVQLGSFERRSNAVALRDELRKKGYTSFLEKASSGSGEMTRVFVGPELDRAQAAALLKKLHAETKLKGLVVQYPDS